MTALDVVFRYGSAPSEAQISAISPLRDVYGIRRIVVNEKEHAIRVEYDASRLKEAAVAALLRRAGFDLLERITLV